MQTNKVAILSTSKFVRPYLYVVSACKYTDKVTANLLNYFYIHSHA